MKDRRKFLVAVFAYRDGSARNMTDLVLKMVPGFGGYTRLALDVFEKSKDLFFRERIDRFIGVGHLGSPSAKD